MPEEIGPVVKATLKTHRFSSDKQAGILARTPEDLRVYLELGFTCVAYGSDLAFLKNGLQNTINLFTDFTDPQL